MDSLPATKVHLTEYSIDFEGKHRLPSKLAGALHLPAWQYSLHSATSGEIENVEATLDLDMHDVIALFVEATDAENGLAIILETSTPPWLALYVEGALVDQYRCDLPVLETGKIRIAARRSPHNLRIEYKDEFCDVIAPRNDGIFVGLMSIRGDTLVRHLSINDEILFQRNSLLLWIVAVVQILVILAYRWPMLRTDRRNTVWHLLSALVFGLLLLRGNSPKLIVLGLTPTILSATMLNVRTLSLIRAVLHRASKKWPKSHVHLIKGILISLICLLGARSALLPSPNAQSQTTSSWFAQGPSNIDPLAPITLPHGRNFQIEMTLEIPEDGALGIAFGRNDNRSKNYVSQETWFHESSEGCELILSADSEVPSRLIVNNGFRPVPIRLAIDIVQPSIKHKVRIIADEMLLQIELDGTVIFEDHLLRPPYGWIQFGASDKGATLWSSSLTERKAQAKTPWRLILGSAILAGMMAFLVLLAGKNNIEALFWLFILAATTWGLQIFTWPLPESVALTSTICVWFCASAIVDRRLPAKSAFLRFGYIVATTILILESYLRIAPTAQRLESTEIIGFEAPAWLRWREDVRVWSDPWMPVRNLQNNSAIPPLAVCKNRNNWLLFGGSIAYGYGYDISQNATLAQHLETGLNEVTTVPIHVWNVAKDGKRLYDMQIRNGAFALGKRCIHTAIISTVVNDAAAGTHESGIFDSPLPASSKSRVLRGLSALAGHTDYIRGMLLGAIRSRDKQKELLYQANIRNFAEQLKEQGVPRLLFLTEGLVPNRDTWPTTVTEAYANFPFASQQYDLLFREVAAERKDLLVNATEILIKHPYERLFWDGVHYTRRGAQLIADAVVRRSNLSPGPSEH